MQSIQSHPQLRRIAPPYTARHVFWIALVSVLAVSACSSNDSDDDDQPPDDGTNGQVIGSPPDQPQALEGVAYTDSQTEIFWGAATDSDGTVIGYDVRRNEDLLVSELDAQLL